MNRVARIIFALLAIVTLPSVGARAQGASFNQRRVLLALTENQLPQGAQAVVVRTAGGSQDDLIIVSDGAGAADRLAAALVVLQKLRRKEPIALHSGKLVLQHSVMPTRDQGTIQSLQNRKIERARGGVRREIPGYGRARVIALKASSLRE